MPSPPGPESGSWLISRIIRATSHSIARLPLLLIASNRGRYAHDTLLLCRLVSPTSLAVLCGKRLPSLDDRNPEVCRRQPAPSAPANHHRGRGARQLASPPFPRARDRRGECVGARHRRDSTRRVPCIFRRASAACQASSSAPAYPREALYLLGRWTWCRIFQSDDLVAGGWTRAA
jgi:hypothetical protein